METVQCYYDCRVAAAYTFEDVYSTEMSGNALSVLQLFTIYRLKYVHRISNDSSVKIRLSEVQNCVAQKICELQERVAPV